MMLKFSFILGATDTLAKLISDSPESFIPGICKELLSSALDVLGQVQEEQESMAQILLKILIKIYIQVKAMTKAYEQAEENPENCKLYLLNTNQIGLIKT